MNVFPLGKIVMSFMHRVFLDFHFFSRENKVTNNLEENLDHSWLFCQEMEKKIKILAS